MYVSDVRMWGLVCWCACIHCLGCAWCLTWYMVHTLQIQRDAKSLANDRDNFKSLYEQVSYKCVCVCVHACDQFVAAAGVISTVALCSMLLLQVS